MTKDLFCHQIPKYSFINYGLFWIFLKPLNLQFQWSLYSFRFSLLSPPLWHVPLAKFFPDQLDMVLPLIMATPLTPMPLPTIVMHMLLKMQKLHHITHPWNLATPKTETDMPPRANITCYSPMAESKLWLIMLPMITVVTWLMLHTKAFLTMDLLLPLTMPLSLITPLNMPLLHITFKFLATN